MLFDHLYIPGLIFLGLLPSFGWLIFYLQEHVKHPEPRKLIFLTFLAGGLSTFIILPVQLFLSDSFSRAGFANYGFGTFFALAGTEELIKFFAVYAFIHANRRFREPLDAMIYMITGALGFAAVENIASLFQVAEGTFLDIRLLESLTLRFVGATLLHSLASGVVGYYWGKGFFDTKRLRTFIVTGLLFATLLHAVFNFLIITTGPATWAIVFLIFVGFFVLNDFEKFKKLDA